MARRPGQVEFAGHQGEVFGVRSASTVRGADLGKGSEHDRRKRLFYHGKLCVGNGGGGMKPNVT